MISADDLLFSFRWGADAFERLVSDVRCERFAEQPVEGVNHPAWLFGHVAIYNDVIVRMLAGQPFDNPWDALCGKNTSPSNDRSAYPTRDEILARHRTGVDAAGAAIASADASAWNAPFEHPTWGKQFATPAPAVTFLATTHLANHVGQLSAWRRTAGLPRI